MGLFVALGIEALALAQLRRATDSAAARTALSDLLSARHFVGPSMLLLLVTGFWLAKVFWHGQGTWIRLGLLGLVAFVAVAALMTGRTARRLAPRLNEPDFDAARRAANATLRRSFVIRALLVIAVVYLMTAKPL